MDNRYLLKIFDPNIFSEIMEFINGTPEYIQKNKSSKKIQEWWKDQYLDPNEYSKKEYIRSMLRMYTKQMFLEFPQFAIWKMALYSGKVLQPVPTELTKKSQSIKWVMDNLDEDDLLIIGL